MNATTLGTFARPTPAKKMAAKSIIGNVKTAIKAAGGKPDQLDDEGNVTEAANFVPLFQATAQIKGIKTGNSTFGEWVAYVGEVWGVNLVTKEVFKGSELYLPSEADIVLRDPLTKALKDGLIVEVAVLVEAALKRTATGYQYRVRPLQALDQSGESRAAQMLMQYAGDVLKLAAPAPAPAAAPAENPAPAQAPAPAPAPAQDAPAPAPAKPSKGTK